MFGNAQLLLLKFDLHGLAPTLWMWYSPVAGHLPGDDLDPPTRITITLSLPADALDSSCGILFFVPGQADTVSISSLHFLRAPINYRIGKGDATIYGTMGTRLPRRFTANSA